MWSVFILMVIALCMGVAAWLIFLWAVKSGQYDDMEGPKYRMLDDDEKIKEDLKSDDDSHLK
ncbi:MAG: cbb3-type cytochrome oxidase assembly protein CcoS [Nitrospirota bacterium]